MAPQNERERPSGTPTDRAQPSAATLEELEDRDLAIRAACGNEQAWEVLYARCYTYLHRFARSLGRGEDAADDLVQETLMRAWTERDRYDPEYPYRGWLRTILRRLSTSEYRRDQAFTNAVRKARGKGLDEDWYGDAPRDAFQGIEIVELRERLTPVLEDMRSDDRTLLLAWAAGAGGKDLAAELEIPPATARGRLMRAKKRLAAAYLEAYDVDASGS